MIQGYRKILAPSASANAERLLSKKEGDVPMEAALEIRQLTGGYSTRRPVLHEVSFAVRPAEMVGLIGLNGAGKSTVIKHILGLLLPHGGEIRITGVRLQDDPDRCRASCAYVPEHPSLFPNLTVEEHLRWTAMAYGIGRDEAVSRMRALAERFRMAEAMGALPGTLSKGMKQKVMLMNALLAETPLLLIDEPFLGLDPLAVRSLLEVLDEARRKGTAILLSSHLLPALEKRADRLVLLHRGRVLAEGTPAEVKALAGLEAGADADLDDAFETLVLAAERGRPVG